MKTASQTPLFDKPAKSRARRPANKRLQEDLARVLWECRTWGELEKAAGVTDRLAFWKDKTEEQARAELRRLIADRLASSAAEKGARP